MTVGNALQECKRSREGGGALGRGRGKRIHGDPYICQYRCYDMCILETLLFERLVSCRMNCAAGRQPVESKIV